MLWAHAWVISHIKGVDDAVLYAMDDYWATAGEVLAARKGDCEDQAILILHKLRAYGFPDDQIGVGIGFNKNRNEAHAFALVQDVDDDDFWILDNGAYCLFPMTAGMLFRNRPDIRLICGFNLFDRWDYSVNHLKSTT